jgi:hypothetical protein
LTVDNCVPTSGTTTIGGVSYSTSLPIQVRAIPNASGYVAVIPGNGTSTNNSIIFRLDQNFNILASASRQTHTSTPSQTGDVLVTNDGVLIIVRQNTDSPNAAFTAIDVDTLDLIQRVVISMPVVGNTFSSYEYGGATIDPQTNRIYTIYSAIVSSTHRVPMPFFTTFNRTTGLFTHFNGTQGNQSITTSGRPESAACLRETQDLMNLLGINIRSFGYSTSRIFHNQYSRPIQIPAGTNNSGHTLQIPYAVPSFSEPSNMNFLGIVQQLFSGTNLVLGIPSMATRSRYQVFWSTGDPSNGFSNRIGNTAISIGDNLFLSIQLNGDTSSDVTYGKLFLRTET